MNKNNHGVFLVKAVSHILTEVKLHQPLAQPEQRSTLQWEFVTKTRHGTALKPERCFDVDFREAMSAGEHARWAGSRLCKLLSTVKTLLFLTRDFLCLVQGSEIYRDVKRANWVWIRDIFIEFTERFLSGYATSSSLNFFFKKKLCLPNGQRCEKIGSCNIPLKKPALVAC